MHDRLADNSIGSLAAPEATLDANNIALPSAVEILESMDEAFYAIDRDWRFIYVNPGAEDFWGRPREDLLRRSMLETFPAFAGSESHAAHVRAMASGERSRIEAISTVTGNPVELHFRPATWGLAVFFRDITERRKTERALIERSELLNLAEQTAEIGVWDIDLDTGMVRGTPQFFRILGIEPTDQPVPITTTRGLRHIMTERGSLTASAPPSAKEKTATRPNTGSLARRMGRSGGYSDAGGSSATMMGRSCAMPE